jgi:hypothetical protein
MEKLEEIEINPSIKYYNNHPNNHNNFNSFMQIFDQQKVVWEHDKELMKVYKIKNIYIK